MNVCTCYGNMVDVIKPHHVSLCVLLRAFLDPEVLQVSDGSIEELNMSLK